MTTIYMEMIHNTRTGYDEIFRTIKPGYVPKGCTLVKNLWSFTIDVVELKTEETRKNPSWHG